MPTWRPNAAATTPASIWAEKDMRAALRAGRVRTPIAASRRWRVLSLTCAPKCCPGKSQCFPSARLDFGFARADSTCARRIGARRGRHFNRVFAEGQRTSASEYSETRSVVSMQTRLKCCAKMSERSAARRMSFGSVRSARRRSISRQRSSSSIDTGGLLSFARRHAKACCNAACVCPSDKIPYCTARDDRLFPSATHRSETACKLPG